MKRAFGERRSKLLRRRITDLQGASSLEDLRHLPQARCREPMGKRRGQLSVDLDYPYRLVFVPADFPVPIKTDGGLDWQRVSEVRILGIIDANR